MIQNADSKEGTRIPRLIHQTYSNWNHLTIPFKENIERIRNMNPEYEYRFYDAKGRIEFIASAYDSRILEAYLKINPAFPAAQSDFFRYLCIYKLGGIYLDVKSKVTKPLLDVLDENAGYILSPWDEKRFPGWGKHSELSHHPLGELQQWHVIAAPGHAFLRKVIECVTYEILNYRPFRTTDIRLSLFRMTGPIVYTNAIYSIINNHPHLLTNISDLGIDYTFLNDSSAHHLVSKRAHYSQVEQCLTLQGPLTNLAFRVCIKTQKVLRNAASIAKSVPIFNSLLKLLRKRK